MEIPQPQNPAVDLDGKYCNMSQNDPNVWYITGTFGGKADRKCEIPFGKAIFFGHGYECSTAETPNLKTNDELLNCAREELKTLVDPSMFAATLDGKPLTNLISYKAISPPFEVNLPENNIWGVRGGNTSAAADTYFIFLEPLERGNHTFAVSSMSAPSQVSATNSPQTLDVKYRLYHKIAFPLPISSLLTVDAWTTAHPMRTVDEFNQGKMVCLLLTTPDIKLNLSIQRIRGAIRPVT